MKKKTYYRVIDPSQPINNSKHARYFDAVNNIDVQENIKRFCEQNKITADKVELEEFVSHKAYENSYRKWISQLGIKIYNGPTQKVVQFVTHDKQVISQYYIEYNDIQISFTELCNIIEDTISSYIENVNEWQQDEMIGDVLASIPEITNFHPLCISKTFII